MFSTDKKAAVIIKSRFKMPSKVKKEKTSFKEYLNYMDRDETKRNEEVINKDEVEEIMDYHLYNDYMGDNTKTTSLFTEHDDFVSEEKKEKLKEAFKKAQERGSVLWQDVVSFDNKWLEENGVYNPKKHELDETKIKDITRLAVKDLLDKNNINNNPVWSGAIHYNTDNIHIHLATVELNPPTDQRRFRKLSTLEGVKSKYINKIMDRSQQHENINDIIRNKIVKDKKERKTFNFFDREFKKDFLQIYYALPENKRYWNYGYQNINHVKPQINELTKKYINKYYSKEFNELENKLDKEVEVLKKAYGEGKQGRYKKYKENKLDDLYKRMGNAFLSEMREYDKKINKINYSPTNYTYKMKEMKRNYAMAQVKYGLDRIVKSEIKNVSNQRAYEQLQRDIERVTSK